MKALWVVAVLSAVVCVVASMVLFGQYALRTKLRADELDQRVRYHSMDTAFSEKKFIRNTLASQIDLQRKTIQELEGVRDMATADERQKAADLDACKTDKKKKDEELAVAQKAQADTEVQLSRESEGWEAEITSLKQEKEQLSKICAYIKKNSDGVKLCNIPKATAPADATAAAETPVAKTPVAAA